MRIFLTVALSLCIFVVIGFGIFMRFQTDFPAIATLVQ